jgi:hypothetical protein
MDLITLAVAQKYTDKAIAQAAVGDIDVESYVKEAVNEVIGGASDTFNSLGEIETAVKNKVDKVSGKGLSTNDFTNAYKTKLDSALTSYTETDPTVPAWAKSATKPTYTASEVGAVPTTRTVNGKALSGNISLSASDVGALPSTTTLFSGNYNDLTNKPAIPSIEGLASETYVDNKIAAMEFILNSSTEGSTKKFKITVDDSGTLTAVEVVE